MKKRWTAALLALALAFTLLPGTAWAAKDDGSAGSRLTGADLAVYQVLKTEIAKIDSGARTDTAIRIPDQSDLSWTLDELGITGNSQSNILNALKEKLRQSLHMDLIYACLSADCPYDFYWKSNECSYGYTSSRSGDRVLIKNITVYLYVAQAYQGQSTTTVSPSKAAEAQAAAEHAKAIVARYQDLSDYEKLAAYCQEICQLADYDFGSARSDIPYGDPWQLVYVFDGDPDTNVVCEGYAKAFKYLCDLSDFDNDILCRIVTGEMNGGSHMWNVVTMEDGKNYLVDVTNCDSGASGAPDKLLLAGAAAADGGRTHTVSKHGYNGVYTYAESEADMFTSGYLTLSDSDYVYDPSAVPAARPSDVSFTDVPEGAYYAEAVAWAVEQGITNGTTETTFSPNQDCTEAEVLTFLWRAAGEPDSGYAATENSPAFWQDALSWFYSIGMLNPNWFVPDTPCTRASAMTSIWWAFRQPDPDGACGFADVAEDASYADAVAWAVEQEITTGTSPTTFDPNSVCTRAQIITFLYRAYSHRTS